jgi:two-component system chemotaxis response regulator CheY
MSVLLMEDTKFI